MTTAELLSETVEATRIREKCEFDLLAEKAERRVVLFGAGRLGRKVSAALRKRGIEPVAFVDNNPRLCGAKVDGINVFVPSAAAELWGDNALFVVTTFRPADGGVCARMNELAALGCCQITNFLPLGWKYDGVLPHFGGTLPSCLTASAAALRKVASLWRDDISRESFRQAINWRLRADFTETTPPLPDQYFPRDIILPNPEESFVDGGAFDGDTLRDARWKFAEVLAIEPDPVSATILRATCKKTIEVRQVLLGNAPGIARFDGSGTMASVRTEDAKLEVPVMTLDNLTSEKSPTFIKLDIEGDELIALQGGVRMLKRTQPVVAVCVYHRPEDLWTIPLFLHETLPAHQLFLRSHAWDGFELVAYAVPSDRCLHPL